MKNQRGFAALGIILAVIVLVAIGGAGYYVYNRQSNKKMVSQTETSETKFIEATDSTKTFSYSYPANWEIKPFVWEGIAHGPAQPEPDWAKEAKPIILYPAENQEIVIEISMGSYEEYGKNRNDGKNFDDLLAYVKEDYFAKILFDGAREDGHRALFTRVDYLGPPDAKVESFTDHRYYFDAGTSVLKIEFREKYHHDWPDDEMGPDIDNSKYLPDFEYIANSIKFN